MVTQRVLNFFKIIRDGKLESKLHREGRDEELEGLIDEGFFFRPKDTLVPNYLDQRRQPFARSCAALALPDATSSARYRSVSENTVDIQRLKQLLHGPLPESEVLTAVPAIQAPQLEMPNPRSALTSHPVHVEDLQVVGADTVYMNTPVNPDLAFPLPVSSASCDPCDGRNQPAPVARISSTFKSPSEETWPSEPPQESFPETFYKPRPASKSNPVLSILTGKSAEIPDIPSSPMEISVDFIDTVALTAGMRRYKRRKSQRLGSWNKELENNNEHADENEETKPQTNRDMPTTSDASNLEIFGVAVHAKGVDCLLDGITPVKRVLVKI